MIRFRGRSLHLREDETVLDCLERSGESVPASCRSGVCQTCLLRATSGEVPPESQQGLTRAQRERGFLLACACRPRGDLDLALGEVQDRFESRVLLVRQLGANVAQLFLEKPAELTFRAGQFLQVVRPADGLTRPYSIASLPGEDSLELHVALHPQGKMSGWLGAAQGQLVALRGPSGECTYHEECRGRPLYLIGTGTGLAPLLGILRDALSRGHEGPIALYHGARNVEGLYLWPQLLELAARHPQLRLEGRVSEAPSSVLPCLRTGRVGIDALPALPELQRAELFLCGNPDLVQAIRRHAYLEGAELARIHADPFVVALPEAGVQTAVGA